MDGIHPLRLGQLDTHAIGESISLLQNTLPIGIICADFHGLCVGQFGQIDLNILGCGVGHKPMHFCFLFFFRTDGRAEWDLQTDGAVVERN